MDDYAIYTLDVFDKEMKKLSQGEQDRIEKLFLQLRENPHVGDQLRHNFFREKRLNGKRIYYLIYDDLKVVLVVAISNKKTQQVTIDRIVRYFTEYRNYVEKLLNG
ncbi:MAG TPA: type II toxin-antitoxin system RelE/ParE family toxin [Candidatus Nanoarchaeia archaeon]|nr:type II toxin-antitoxin system RelE/ParE family toxin [Candidatus Nanoarchaeia archaeon]